VFLDRLVEVHRPQDRCVEPSEELRGHDQELKRVGGITEPIEDLAFFVGTELVVTPLVVALTDRHDNRTGLCGQVGVKGIFDEHAGLAVIDHDLTLEVVWLNTLEEVTSDVVRHARNVLGALEQLPEARRPLGDLLQVLIGQVAGKFPKSLVDRTTVDPMLDQTRFEPDQQGGTVAD
jgi:hypothetical protein